MDGGAEEPEVEAGDGDVAEVGVGVGVLEGRSEVGEIVDGIPEGVTVPVAVGSSLEGGEGGG